MLQHDSREVAVGRWSPRRSLLQWVTVQLLVLSTQQEVAASDIQTSPSLTWCSILRISPSSHSKDPWQQATFRMSPSTDPKTNPLPAVYTDLETEMALITPHGKQVKRPSSWFQHHSTHFSNPFFLSRRAREQHHLLRDKRQERKSGTFQDISHCSKFGDDISLVAIPHTLQVHGISQGVEPVDLVSRKKSRVSQQVNKYQAPNKVSEKGGIGKDIGSSVGEAFEPLSDAKANFCKKNKSLPQLNIVAPGHPANLACHVANLLDDGLPNQNHSHKEVTVRRKAMRTVSNDDYLLARGANPRTGVVTPSLHSGSSSIDDQELLRTWELPQHAKWRLKDDQWVSLGLDEPSPLPSSPSIHNDRRPGRPLRTPPKLAHGRQTQYRTHIHDHEQHGLGALRTKADNIARFYQPAEQNEKLFANSEDKGIVQDSAFPAKSSPGAHERSGKDSRIRRKPLGTPPSKPLSEDLFYGNDLPEASTESVTTKTSVVEQARSSSMPTPRKLRFFRPEDIGKALPALPGLKPNDHLNVKDEYLFQAMPFLGQRPGNWKANVLKKTDLAGHGSGKRLPYLPTNDIQSQQSSKGHISGSAAIVLPIYTNDINKQLHKVYHQPHSEGRTSTLLRSRPMITTGPYQLAQPIRTEQSPGRRDLMGAQDASDSKAFQPMPQLQPTSMTGQMTPRNKGAGTGSDTCTSPPTIKPILAAQTLPEDKLVSSSWREMPSPLRPGRQRATTASRPAMPERAEGTNNVPQVTDQMKLPERCQGGITGTSGSGVSANSTSVEGRAERDLIPRPLRPSNGNTTSPGRLGKVTARSVTDAEQATQNRHRRQDSSVKDQRHDMDGFTRRQGNKLTENIDPQADLSYTSGFLQDTPKDHSGCCAECCVVGCHGSCLGHRSPSMTVAASGFAGALGAMKEGFRNSMRLSRRIRVRTSAGGSRETETEEIAELDTPMCWEIPGPVSLGLPSNMEPPDFWDSGQTKDGSQRKGIASNASGSSVKTLEMPAAAGIGAVFEALVVPFNALRMCLKTHPQLMVLMQMMMLKLLEMSKHVLDTIGSAYRVTYIYSKTGRISPGKSSSLGKFASDCVKAVVYCLIIGAVAMMVGKMLAVLAGAGSWLIWCLSWVAWIVKAVGLGILW